MKRGETKMIEQINTSLSPQSGPENRQPVTPVSRGEEKFHRLQRVWSENCAPVTEPVKHDRVSVLLLSWEKEGSDMDVSEEVSLSASELNANGTLTALSLPSRS